MTAPNYFGWTESDEAVQARLARRQREHEIKMQEHEIALVAEWLGDTESDAAAWLAFMYDTEAPTIPATDLQAVRRARMQAEENRHPELITADADPRSKAERAEDDDWRDEMQTRAAVRPL